MNAKNCLITVLFILFGFAMFVPVVYSQMSEEVTQSSFFKGEITRILSREEDEKYDIKELKQVVEVELSKSKEKIIITYIVQPISKISDYYLKEGDKVIVSKDFFSGSPEYHVYDRYRLGSIFVIFLIFVLGVVIFSGWKGLSSLLGLFISILIIYFFIVPRIIRGENPIIIGLMGTFAIAVLSIYTSHGFNKRTSVALLSTLITLSAGIILSILFVDYAWLFGLGQEEALLLQVNSSISFDLKGLLLCGIIIGTLGVLDDITTAQVSTVDEIRKANTKLSRKELYKRGLSVGREHISSLVNTLVMAYVGASLPLFLLFYVGSGPSFWVTLNSEFIAEEVIRTLVGSMALVLAVPISTLLASYILPRSNDSQKKHGRCDCHELHLDCNVLKSKG